MLGCHEADDRVTRQVSQGQMLQVTHQRRRNGDITSHPLSFSLAFAFSLAGLCAASCLLITLVCAATECSARRR